MHRGTMATAQGRSWKTKKARHKYFKTFLSFRKKIAV